MDGDRVSQIRTLPLRTPDGPLSGLVPPGGEEAATEPTFDLAGRRLPPDPAGVDPEGPVARKDGGFWIPEEYGPSFLRVDEGGLVQTRSDAPAAPRLGLEGMGLLSDRGLLIVTDNDFGAEGAEKRF